MFDIIKGQDKICNLINSLTLDTFPRTLMLVGPQGSGKHMLAKLISNHLNLQMLDITEQLDLETIDEIYNRVEPYLYIIEANKLSVKEENVILKFLEEPLKNSYIVLLAETDMGLLQTIINRCVIWHLQNYNKATLMEFVPNIDNINPYLFDIATTPGQIQTLSSIDLNAYVELADKIITKINIASLANTLTLTNKIDFKADSAINCEKDKLQVRLFVQILLSRFSAACKQNSNIKLIQGYTLTSELNKQLYVKNLDTKALFDRYLVQLRNLMRGE